MLMFSPGEVGKLLGAKWKELDDEEKKVCYSRSAFQILLLMSSCSPTPTWLPKTRSAQKKTKQRTKLARSLPQVATTTLVTIRLLNSMPSLIYSSLSRFSYFVLYYLPVVASSLLCSYAI